MKVKVALQYADSGNWDYKYADTISEARELAREHLQSPTSQHNTRARVYEPDGSVWSTTDYGHSAGYVDGPKYYKELESM